MTKKIDPASLIPGESRLSIPYGVKGGRRVGIYVEPLGLGWVRVELDQTHDRVPALLSQCEPVAVKAARRIYNPGERLALVTPGIDDIVVQVTEDKGGDRVLIRKIGYGDPIARAVPVDRLRPLDRYAAKAAVRTINAELDAAGLGMIEEDQKPDPLHIPFPDAGMEKAYQEGYAKGIEPELPIFDHRGEGVPVHRPLPAPDAVANIWTGLNPKTRKRIERASRALVVALDIQAERELRR